MRYLANISTVLLNPEAIKEILAEKDPAVVKKLFLDYGSSFEDTKKGR